MLLLLAVPFFHLNLGLIDDRVVPPDMSEPRARPTRSAQNFSSREADALQVLAPGRRAHHATPPRSTRSRASSASCRASRRVDAATGYYLVEGRQRSCSASHRSPAHERGSSARHRALGTCAQRRPRRRADVAARASSSSRDIRATTRTVRASRVAGRRRALVDTKRTIDRPAAVALGLIALATFVLLFLMTGSVLVPIKALAAQHAEPHRDVRRDGVDLPGGPPHAACSTSRRPAAIDVFTPILMFCIAFGLSMDYEVFLLSRIKEEYDLDRDNEHAVAVGLQKTGRIVTAAALLLTIVFLGIATSEVALVKTFGVGLALAVLVDAFLIRATLVPAFMRLAGRVNWWSPRWLRRWHLRFGIWENEPIAILDREFEAEGLSARLGLTRDAPRSSRAVLRSGHRGAGDADAHRGSAATPGPVPASSTHSYAW